MISISPIIIALFWAKFVFAKSDILLSDRARYGEQAKYYSDTAKPLQVLAYINLSLPPSPSSVVINQSKVSTKLQPPSMVTSRDTINVKSIKAFTCLTNQEIISIDQVCDGTAHCANQTDEDKQCLQIIKMGKLYDDRAITLLSASIVVLILFYLIVAFITVNACLSQERNYDLYVSQQLMSKVDLLTEDIELSRHDGYNSIVNASYVDDEQLETNVSNEHREDAIDADSQLKDKFLSSQIDDIDPKLSYSATRDDGNSSRELKKTPLCRKVSLTESNHNGTDENNNEDTTLKESQDLPLRNVQYLNANKRRASPDVKDSKSSEPKFTSIDDVETESFEERMVTSSPINSLFNDQPEAESTQIILGSGIHLDSSETGANTITIVNSKNGKIKLLLV